MSTGLGTTEAAVTVPINLTAPAIIPHARVSPLSGGPADDDGPRWLRSHEPEPPEAVVGAGGGASALGALVGGRGGRGRRGVLRALLRGGGAAGGLAGGAAGLRGHPVTRLPHLRG